MRGLPPHELVESALFSSICDVRQHMREFADDPVTLGQLKNDLTLLSRAVTDIEQIAKADA